MTIPELEKAVQEAEIKVKTLYLACTEAEIALRRAEHEGNMAILALRQATEALKEPQTPVLEAPRLLE